MNYSKQGYKKHSPDRNRPFNIIPSGNITMKGVPHPVFGLDETGATALMMPGAQYTFPGQSVLEIPLHMQQGGSTPLDKARKTYGEGENFTPPNDPDLHKLVYLTDLINNALASGKDPATTKQGRILFSTPGKVPGTNTDLGKVYNAVYLFNQRSDTRKLHPEERINMFYNTLQSADPDITAFKNKVKTLGYGPVEFFRSTPSVETHEMLQAADQVAAKPTFQIGGNTQGNGSPFWGVAGVAGLSMFDSWLEHQQRKDQQAYQRKLGMTDSLGPVVPGSRGDYSVNEGFFRPDQYTPVQYGAIPYAAAGGYFDAPMQAPVYVPPSPAPMINPQPPTQPPTPDASPNQAARDAFRYYVEEKKIPGHIAAGIVGNLFQESRLKPAAREKENKGNGRGIAQWDVRNRWKGLLDWAQKSGQNPMDLKTQLNYVLEEPGEGSRVMKKLAATRTPEEAAVVFGKLFERPSEKHARWDVRKGVAGKLMAGKFQEGGEYEITPNELIYILRNGGQVEYLK